MCVAPTGSGKTLAYALPIIVKLADPARSLRGKIEGKGVRAVVLVPTQDLAVQIHSVLRAVTRGRAWRCLVLTKATERAVCESSPGLNASTHAADNEDNESGGDDEDGAFDEDGDEIEDENEGFVDQNSSMERGLSGDRRPPLGIDVLIATPERMHHLIEGQRLSLASSVCPSRFVWHC
jgi:ATP-dependent RNA helicase DDX52/ROK1